MHERKILDRILDRDNLNRAYKQVKKNKGEPGVDGMTVTELRAHLLEKKQEITTQIRRRKYQPSPVLRVEIPKDSGKGVRLLEIPTVQDRLIQQAISQVLTPIYDKEFSIYSYGFRPRRYAEMAIVQALEYMNDGYDWIVDIDLERFFDTVHHDRLMNLVSRTIDDGDVISLIRGWINYFKIGHMKTSLKKIETHTCFRLRMCIWKKWKTAKNRRRNLMKLGMDKYNAYKYAHTSKGAVRIAYSWVLTTTITNKRLKQFGLVSCLEHYNKVHI